MDEKKKNSQIARILAALALVGAVLLTVVVISGATGGEEGGNDKPNNQARQQQKQKPKTNAKTYEVEEGDTLITISQKTGIPVGQLERLNPDLDPQALQLGQELNLR